MPRDSEKRRAYLKAWCETHKEQRAIYLKAYDKTYRQTHKLSLMEYRKAHQEGIKVYQKRWSETHKEQIRTKNQARKARERNALIERVDVGEVYEREQGICGICHRKVSRKNFSLDHILPLAKGGEHSYRNTQIAHRSCNSRKQDRAMPPQQLRLIG